MLARPVVLLTPRKSSHPSQLLSRQQLASASPLSATLMNLLASVANKRLTLGLSPLDATLTKAEGRAYSSHSGTPRARPLSPGLTTARPRTLHLLFPIPASPPLHKSPVTKSPVVHLSFIQ